MGSTKKPERKITTGITKAGRSSRSGGKYAGRNGAKDQGRVLEVTKRSSATLNEIRTQALQLASDQSLMALRGKLRTEKNLPILEVAEHLLAAIPTARPSRDPRTGAPMPANAVAKAATEQHFKALGLRAETVKAGINAAFEEFKYQYSSAHA